MRAESHRTGFNYRWDILDLTALPRESYWRAGIGDLLATEAGLSLQAMLDLLHERSLAVELTIEGTSIDPVFFVHHFQEWSAAYLVVRLHRVLDPILDQLEGEDPASGRAELLALARWLRATMTAERG